MEEHAAENGLVYDSVWDHDKMMGCSCDPGWFGFDCSNRDCPRGDDPLTQNQVSRAIALTVTAPTGGEVDGRLRFGFLGESVLLPAVLDAATCGRAISSLPTVQKASCSQTTDGWLVTFDEWAPAPVRVHVRPSSSRSSPAARQAAAAA